MKTKTPLLAGWHTMAWNQTGKGHLFREPKQGTSVYWSLCGRPCSKNDLQSKFIKKCARCEKSQSKFTAE